MKKKLTAFFTGASLVLTIFNFSYAQNYNSTVKLSWQSSVEKFITSSGEINQAGDSGSLRLNELNSRAVRNFIREYKHVSDAKWYDYAHGFHIAYFVSEGIKNWVLYTKKGYYSGTGRHYTEEKLPPDIRHRVKSIYYDFSIYHITETNLNEKLTYLISIEDKRRKDKIFYKMIRVVDGGEMEVMKEYSEKVNHED